MWAFPVPIDYRGNPWKIENSVWRANSQPKRLSDSILHLFYDAIFVYQMPKWTICLLNPSISLVLYLFVPFLSLFVNIHFYFSPSKYEWMNEWYKIGSRYAWAIFHWLPARSFYYLLHLINMHKDAQAQSFLFWIGINFWWHRSATRYTLCLCNEMSCVLCLMCIVYGCLISSASHG